MIFRVDKIDHPISQTGRHRIVKIDDGVLFGSEMVIKGRFRDSAGIADIVDRDLIVAPLLKKRISGMYDPLFCGIRRIPFHAKASRMANVYAAAI
jgi:hypothetical protein